MLCSNYLARMSPPRYTLLPFVQRYTHSGCPSCLSFITVIIQAHGATKLYENLTYIRMRPAATTSNYSVENIRNDVHQKITYEKSPFDSLAWGLLMFAPIRSFQNSMCNWKLTSCNTAVFIYPVLRQRLTVLLSHGGVVSHTPNSFITQSYGEELGNEVTRQ